MGRPAAAPAAGWPVGRGDLGASLVLIFPLVLAYAIGVLVTGRVTGADLASRALLVVVGNNRSAYLLIYAALATLFLIWIRRTRRDASLSLEIAIPMLLEAAIYAFTLGAVISLVVDRLGLGMTGASAVGAIGAGVHEELVFRLGIMGGLVAWSTPRVNHRVAVALAIVLSSVAFSAAHYAGSAGDVWSLHTFVFRCLAGVAFAAIFWFRSLAHAVYAHVLYDLVVALR